MGVSDTCLFVGVSVSDTCRSLFNYINIITQKAKDGRGENLVSYIACPLISVTHCKYSSSFRYIIILKNKIEK